MKLVKVNEELAEDIKDIITEYVFQSRWMLIEGHWLVGKRIREYETDSVSELLQGLAVATGISERTLWYCVKFYDTYPDIQKLPDGKNISWNKVITKYLTEKADGKEPPECTHKPVVICSKCRKVLLEYVATKV